MEGFDLSTVSGIYKGSSEISALYLGDTLIYPTNYEEEYLTICSLDTNNQVILNMGMSTGWSDETPNYSFQIQVSRDKKTWTTYTVDVKNNQNVRIATLGRANKLYLRGSSQSYTRIWDNNYYYARIVCTGQYKLQGNIMSLVASDNYNNITTLENNALRGMFSNNTGLVDIENLYMPATTLDDYCYVDLFSGCNHITDISTLNLPATTLAEGCYQGMFKNCTGLTDISDFLLPVTTLADYCYKEMFSGCTSLTTPITLPITTLATGCYNSMFEGCTSLTSAPALSSTSLAESCYEYMFYGCSSLTSAPTLPATTLYDYCYLGMFQGCTSLTSAPNLSATTLAAYCYSYMFHDCTSLTTAPTISATTLASNCCQNMFFACISLTTAPTLSATTLANSCYNGMFNNCISLISAPNLSATTLAQNCYKDMFRGCTSLATAPTISATTLASNCCQNMFYGCTSLVTAPTLSATTLANSCYNGMFMGCRSLTTAPSLPATTLAPNCYKEMFRGCTSLTTAPALPATTLANYCYDGMFRSCTSLTTAPDLLATITSANYCYRNMFNGCSSLNYIKCLSRDVSSYYCTENWVTGVAATGTFVKYPNIQIWSEGNSGIPTGWTVSNEQSYTVSLTQTNHGTFTAFPDFGIVGERISVYQTPDYGYKLNTYSVTCNGSSVQTYPNGDNFYFYMPNGNVTVSVTFVGLDYADEYLTIESLSDYNLIKWECYNSEYPSTIYYSTNKSNWTSVTSNINGALVKNMSDGDKIYIKGSYVSSSSAYSRFTSTGNFKVYGNIMSLTDGDNFVNSTTLTSSYHFANLFNHCSYLIDAYNLILPATTLTDHCYYRMFYMCGNLTVPPSTLPATTLANSCYYSMFAACGSLTSAPMLPATTLAQSCYNSMFKYCSSLLYVQSELPATTLAQSCYVSMFESCSSLNSAPILPASTLTSYCYYSMFAGCSSLSYIKCLATDISATNCTKNWVMNVASSGTFVKANSMTSWTTGDNGIPSNWTIPAPLSITIYSSQNGSVTSDKQVAYAGDTVTLTVTPYAGYGLDTLTVLNSNLNPVTITVTQQGYEFTMPSSNVTVSATFSAVLYAITVNSAQHGSVTSNKQSATYGEEITLTVSPDTGYELDTLTVVDANSNPVTVTAITGGYKFDMPASNVTVSAAFDTLSYTITIGQTTDGTVTSDKNTARYGDTVTLTITPDTGYSLDNLTVVDANSNPITVTNNQFSMPASNVSVSATFVQSYDGQYLTIESQVANNTIGWKSSNSSYSQDIQYSTNLSTWTTVTSTTAGATLATLGNGDKLYLKGALVGHNSGSRYEYITSSGNFKLYGNIMSLTNGDNFVGVTSLTQDYQLVRLFNNSKVTNAYNLIMPATTLTNYCYQYLFANCSQLVTAPRILPATTINYYSYGYMFQSCPALTNPPILNGITLNGYSYAGMFQSCTSLTSLPRLADATSFNSWAPYRYMFSGCTGIIDARYDINGDRLLPNHFTSTGGTGSAFELMFQNCTNLTYAPELTDTDAHHGEYNQMFKGCTSLYSIITHALSLGTANFDNIVKDTGHQGTVYKAKDVTWDTSKYSQFNYDSSNAWNIVDGDYNAGQYQT